MDNALLSAFGSSVISFDDYTLRTPSGVLRKDNIEVKIEPQLLQFLLLLIQESLNVSDPIVGKDKLVSSVWDGKGVSDDAVRASLKKLRDTLQDDARHPRYIKTIPTKGYLFIAKVEVHKTDLKTWRSRVYKYLSIFSAVVLITLLSQYAIEHFFNSTRGEKRSTVSTKIGTIQSDEVNPYLHKNNQLIFSYKQNADDHSHWYIKNLRSAALSRFTWGEQQFSAALISPDGNQFLLRQETKGELGPRYKLLNGQNATELDVISVLEALDGRDLRLLSWARDAQSVFVLDNANAARLYHLNINSSQLSSINIAGLNEPIKVLETSPTGDNVAIITVNSAGRHQLHIYSQGAYTKAAAEDASPNSGNTAANLVADMPSGANKLIWSEDGSRLSYSSYAGAIYTYLLAEQRTVRWQGLDDNPRALLSDCGEGCFVVHALNADYLDISEQPILVNDAAMMFGAQIRLSGADDLPMYNTATNSIYFVSVDASATTLYQLSLNSPEFGVHTSPQALFTLPIRGTIRSLAINPQASAIVGEVEGRLFLYRLDSGSFSFVTQREQSASFPVWSSAGNSFVFSMLDEETVYLYQYDLDSSLKKQLPDSQGMLATRELENESRLFVDTDLALIIETKGQRSSMATLPSAAPSRWRYKDGEVFYLASEEGRTYLFKLDLSTAKIDQRALQQKLHNFNFDIHPNRNSILVVENAATQSDILRIEGLYY